MPPVVRNSVGEVCLPRASDRRRVYEPEPDANSEETPESVLHQQIDDIYELTRTVPQYFDDNRFPPRLGSAIVDERDQSIYEENSVRIAV